jgi:type IV pilus assembly protein PilF
MMLREDPRRTHVAAEATDIVALYESTNQPMVATPGRAAQTASAAVVAVRAQAGFEVLVALTFVEQGGNLVYAPDEPVSQADLPQTLEEALDFAESMGFILDSTGWPKLDRAQRAEVVSRMTVFRPAPQKREAVQAQAKKSSDPLATVARLFAAFALLLAAATAGCSGPSAEQRKRSSEIHYDLGTSMLEQGDVQGALKEYLQAEQDDDELPQVHNALGLLYAFSVQKPQEAEEEFKKALALDKDFSEAHNNLGTLYLSRARYEEAARQFELALANPLYRERIFAESNLGYALYKSGQQQKGLQRIEAALAVSPKYCQGWRQLGTLRSERGEIDAASEAFQKYAAACPDEADAHLLAGKVLARQTRALEAREEFRRCAQTKQDRDEKIRTECQRLLRDLGAR